MNVTVHLCASCEVQYSDSPDDRRRHQMIFGHVASPAAVIVPAPATKSGPCKRPGKWGHKDCGGGFLRDGEPAACSCECHDDDWEREMSL